MTVFEEYWKDFWPILQRKPLWSLSGIRISSHNLDSKTAYSFLEAECFLKLIPVEDQIREFPHLMDPA